MNEFLTNDKVEKLGWKPDSKHDFGDCYKWNSDWNSPRLFIGKKKGYHSIHILKFDGQNSWYGKMDTAFKGKVNNIKQLKLICELLELDNYWHGKF